MVSEPRSECQPETQLDLPSSTGRADHAEPGGADDAAGDSEARGIEHIEEFAAELEAPVLIEREVLTPGSMASWGFTACGGRDGGMPARAG